MKDINKYDVVIVGSGPAGAFLGYLLSRVGWKALILEKERLPRYKACGGGLTKRALDIIPFDPGDIIEDYSFTAHLSLQNELIVTKTTNHPMLGMVMRDKFDYFLAKKAVDAGADLLQNTVFKLVSGPAGDLKVETSRGTFRTRFIVGADGAVSTVARKLGLARNRAFIKCMQGEVFLRSGEVVEKFRNTVHFDFGVIPQGYGWIFPKREHLSIGVLSASKQINPLETYFVSYLKMKNLYSDAEIRSLKGHLIPSGIPGKRLFADSRGLLVGDAAGFADPVTGEGIYYALREAEIAAEVLSDGLSADCERVEIYNSLIKEAFQKELTYANRLGYLFYNLSDLGYDILKAHGKKLAEFYLDILTCTRTYEDLYYKMFALHRTVPVLVRGASRN